jgi:hypothetical protein
MYPDAASHRAASAFDVMSEGFARAAEANPKEATTACIRLANRRVVLRLVGRDLAAHTLRPFEHLCEEPCGEMDPRLTVEIWDERVTGVGLGTLQSEVDRSKPSTPVNESGRFSFNRHQNTTLCLDHANGHLVGCCRGADVLSLYELGRPFHVPIVLWHNGQDVPVVHAGLVAMEDKGILLAGPAGVGKSTAAVTCLLGGFTYLSDDLIGVESLPDGSFRGHSIYNSTYFEEDHLKRFPQLAPHAIKSRHAVDDKSLIILSSVLPSRIGRTTPIRAVVLSELGRSVQSTFRSASPAKALMALAPPTLAINRELGPSGFEKLARLVESVPCFHLMSGSDLDGIPIAVRELVDEIGDS